MKNLLVVIVPAGHPLANQPGIAPARLAEEPFIMREQDPLPDSLPNAFFQQQRVNLKTRMTAGSNVAIQQLVADDPGLALLPLHIMTVDESSAAFVVLEIKGLPILRQWYAVYPKEKHISAVTR